jgi:excisionase family DNA binding protein
MQAIRRSKNNVPEVEQVLDINATMQGTMVFKDPVNIRISGDFEGKLQTKGTLAIGANAQVKADIEGEDITVAGKVIGNIIATQRLKLVSPAHITGDISTPVLAVSEGAVLNGKCHMSVASDFTAPSSKLKAMALDEVARYLEVDLSLVEEWASQKKIPATRENNAWKFQKQDIDNWLAKEKIGK